ncbi:hypothetical protein BDQ12DRAFT_103977 [Crucibulum laeve]|uniref:Uncharacterized protein n=1 Tax=Crucibulum laeve TaxID=68775 RepID=A0A5C3LFN1_9AGAR|nr:hypothetical protein BDQ12DRAFT_103977 [Crucibulum laeve]
MWNNIREEGCTVRGSGLRRVKAKLENLHPDDDAQVMCKSTPFDFRGEHFEGPMSCAKSWGRSQMFGYWYIRDDKCR